MTDRIWVLTWQLGLLRLPVFFWNKSDTRIKTVGAVCDRAIFLQIQRFAHCGKDARSQTAPTVSGISSFATETTRSFLPRLRTLWRTAFSGFGPPCRPTARPGPRDSSLPPSLRDLLPQQWRYSLSRRLH